MPSLGPSFGRKGVMTTAVDPQRVAMLRSKRIILGSQSFARKQIMTVRCRGTRPGRGAWGLVQGGHGWPAGMTEG